jgi:cobalt/nickel transport protein
MAIRSEPPQRPSRSSSSSAPPRDGESAPPRDDAFQALGAARRPSVARTILGIVAGVAVAYTCVTLLSERLRFGGTDDRASSAITESQPGYQRWVFPLWTPGNRTVEVLLFGLQALLGAGVLGWSIARLRGRDVRDARDPQDVEG